MSRTVRKLLVGDRVRYVDGGFGFAARRHLNRTGRVIRVGGYSRGDTVDVRWDDDATNHGCYYANLELLTAVESASVSADDLRSQAEKLKTLADLADELGYNLSKKEN